LRTNLTKNLLILFPDFLKQLLGFTESKKTEKKTEVNSNKVENKPVKKLFVSQEGKSVSPEGRFKSHDGNNSPLPIKFNIGAGTTTPTAVSKNAIGRSPFLYRAQYSQDRDFEKLVKAHQQTKSNTESSITVQPTMLLTNNKFTKSPVHDLNKPGRLIPDLVGGRGKNGNIHHVIIESLIEEELRIDYISSDWVKKIKMYLLDIVIQSLQSIKKNSRHLCEKIFDPGRVPNITYYNVHNSFGLQRDNNNPNIPEGQQRDVVIKMLKELEVQTERLLHLDISEIAMDKFVRELQMQETNMNLYGYDQNWSTKKFDIRKTLNELMKTLRAMADRADYFGAGNSRKELFVDDYKLAYSIFFAPSEKVEYGKHNLKYLDRIWKNRNSFDKSRRIDDIFGTTELDYEIIISVFLRIMDKDSQNIRYVTDLETLRNTRKRIGKRNFIIGIVREDAPQHANRRHTSSIPHYNVFKADGHVVTRYSISEGENNVFEALVFVVLLCVKYNVRSRDSGDMIRCLDMMKNIFTKFTFANFNRLRQELQDEYNFDLYGDDSAEDDD